MGLCVILCLVYQASLGFVYILLLNCGLSKLFNVVALRGIYALEVS